MKRLLIAASALLSVMACQAHASDTPETVRTIRSCITAAAEAHRLPPAMIVILLRVEGGSLGATSQNTNSTSDIGPMQVNTIWVPQVAQHWHASPAATYLALRDNFCANVEAGAWILRKGLDEARGDFWEGVGYYHSHAPEHKARYLRLVLDQVLHLQKLADRPAATRPTVAAPSGVKPTIVASSK